MARYGRDRLQPPARHPADHRQRLIARLATSAFAHGTQLWLQRSRGADRRARRVTGVVYSATGAVERVMARGGVVCAMGGPPLAPGRRYRPRSGRRT
jgi:hypothetical protein